MLAFSSLDFAAFAVVAAHLEFDGLPAGLVVPQSQSESMSLRRSSLSRRLGYDNRRTWRFAGLERHGPCFTVAHDFQHNTSQSELGPHLQRAWARRRMRRKFRCLRGRRRQPGGRGWLVGRLERRRGRSLGRTRGRRRQRGFEQRPLSRRAPDQWYPVHSAVLGSERFCRMHLRK